jgi:hypothetical protein
MVIIVGVEAADRAPDDAPSCGAIISNRSAASAEGWAASIA